MGWLYPKQRPELWRASISSNQVTIFLRGWSQALRCGCLDSKYQWEDISSADRSQERHSTSSSFSSSSSSSAESESLDEAFEYSSKHSLRLLESSSMSSKSCTVSIYLIAQASGRRRFFEIWGAEGLDIGLLEGGLQRCEDSRGSM